MTDKKTEELIAYALKRVDRQIEDAFLGPFGASLTEGSPSEEIMQCLAKSAEKFQRDDNNTIRIYASACLALLGRAWKAEAELDAFKQATEGMSEKLQVLADWLDIQEPLHPEWCGGHDVQDDLRKLAKVLSKGDEDDE